MSNFYTLNTNKSNAKIESFKVDDEYYKKLLSIDPIKTMKKDAEKVSIRKHLKKASCNNDFFFKNKIATMLNNDGKEGKDNRKADNSERNTSQNRNSKENKDENDKRLGIQSKTDRFNKNKSNNRLFEINMEKARFQGDFFKEEKEEDEITPTNKIAVSKVDIFAELSKSNKELKDLMGFSYNKVNTSNITEENSMLSFSLTDQFTTTKKSVYQNHVNFEKNEDYLKKTLFNN